MIGIPLLVVAGPCLLMALAAAAMVVVHQTLNPARYAEAWAAACALAAAGWAMIAIRGFAGLPPLHVGFNASMLQLASIVLFADGFRIRAGRPHASLPIAVMTGGGVLLAIAFVASPMPLRAAIMPLASLILCAWAARLVVLPRQAATGPEIGAIGMLVALAAINAVAAALAVAEQAGLLGSHHLYVALYAVSATPSCAAMALFGLLLVAADVSTELKLVLHTDPLTGVLNREGFREAAQAALRRARPRARPLSIAIADIDRFKQINDRHGHAAGDATLASFADHLARTVGGGGTVGRIGGEEFALLFPGRDGASVLRAVDPVSNACADVRVDGSPRVSVTASFGVAERHPDESLDALIERADRALYRSKREGRNRATLAQAASA
ncbi:GGDEF domain-containing protein [Sphingomonas nostoxanthinifaciens]|uniref:GGDEF domain-containing protein n=1 Tax=Sphingomonas nostoxanthinifaciens TaxID=2872652 RepID=UPI001CC2010D|nr:GGDEF domain-containing protein [Sphingomonas nostoxanthinifaciens]UAK25404.1 GGDEF domain-containing protein [Sphingomonas nostoxanthinifaciens]